MLHSMQRSFSVIRQGKVAGASGAAGAAFVVKAVILSVTASVFDSTCAASAGRDLFASGTSVIRISGKFVRRNNGCPDVVDCRSLSSPLPMDIISREKYRIASHSANSPGPTKPGHSAEISELTNRCTVPCRPTS